MGTAPTSRPRCWPPRSSRAAVTAASSWTARSCRSASTRSADPDRLATEAGVVVEVGLEEAAHGGVGLGVAVVEEPLLGLLRLGVKHCDRRGGRARVGHR